jgi:hypothetical protein
VQNGFLASRFDLKNHPTALATVVAIASHRRSAVQVPRKIADQGCHRHASILAPSKRIQDTFVPARIQFEDHSTVIIETVKKAAGISCAIQISGFVPN